MNESLKNAIIINKSLLPSLWYHTKAHGIKGKTNISLLVQDIVAFCITFRIEPMSKLHVQYFILKSFVWIYIVGIKEENSKYFPKENPTNLKNHVMKLCHEHWTDNILKPLLILDISETTFFDITRQLRFRNLDTVF